MKYLLSALFFLLFITQPIKVSADECSTKRPGDSCGAYTRINSTNCQTCYGKCSTQLVCISGSNDFCSNAYSCDNTSTSPPIINPPPPALLPSQNESGIITGAQIVSEQAIRRLTPSQYSFKWLKFQFTPGSPQPLSTWVKTAKNAGFKVLISIAKNYAGIQPLQNPDYPEKQDDGHPAYTQKYCPWDSELESYQKGTGRFNCDEQGKNCVEEMETIILPAKRGNGYIEFRDAMQTLGVNLQAANIDAVEIWNEPNLAVEWSKLGSVNPKNYANFLICGIKGLKAGGYQGKIISAGLAPNAPTDGVTMDDLAFFLQFYNEYYQSTNTKYNSHEDNIDAFGWHGNTRANIPPDKDDSDGFQRFTKILYLTKNKPLWMTEYGWPRNALDKNESKARQLQASYITQAYDVIKGFPNVKAMFVFNFGFTKDASTNPQIKDFIEWDIEGINLKICQPNPEVKNPIPRGDTKYVQDTSVRDDVVAATVAGQALIPAIVIQDVNKKYLSPPPKTKVDVTSSFLSTLPGFQGMLQWVENIASFLNINKIACQSFSKIISDKLGFCRPNISIGKAEKEDPNKDAPGQNTPQFADQAKILGQAGYASGMELTPEDKDCNIGQLSEEQDIGNQKINDLSENLGTATGFYGNGMPNFKDLNPDDWEVCMEDRMQAENLNISNKLFVQDRRSPDIYCRKQIFCKGNYPNGICPFEPTPTPNPMLKPI